MADAWAGHFGTAWGASWGSGAVTASAPTTGGHRKRPVPEEVAREQAMVEQYLRTLEKPKAKRKAAVLTQPMLEAATDVQLHRLVESAKLAAQERAHAETEYRRRYWAAFLTLVQ